MAKLSLTTSSVPICHLIPVSRKKRELNITTKAQYSVNCGPMKALSGKWKKQLMNFFFLSNLHNVPYHEISLIPIFNVSIKNLLYSFLLVHQKEEKK